MGVYCNKLFITVGVIAIDANIEVYFTEAYFMDVYCNKLFITMGVITMYANIEAHFTGAYRNKRILSYYSLYQLVLMWKLNTTSFIAILRALTQ